MRVAVVLLAVVLLIFASLFWANAIETPLPLGVIADKVLVEKSVRNLTLLKNGQVIKQYKISLGKRPIGDKSAEGDQRTPEGLYKIDRRNPSSPFYLSLHVSYPDAEHMQKAHQLGVSPGGDIMIHGLPRILGWAGKFQRHIDWTAGCIALTNPEIEEIWRAVPDGTPIEIVP